MSRIKGIVLKSLRDYLCARGAPTAFDAALERMVPADRQALGAVILTTTWHPMEQYQKFLRATLEVLGGSSEAAGTAFGRFMLENNLNRLYRFALGLLTPQLVMTMAPRLWKMYFDGEELELSEVGPKSLVARVHGPAPLNTYHCYAVLGGMLETISQTGGKDISGRHKACRIGGAGACEFRIEWR